MIKSLCRSTCRFTSNGRFTANSRHSVFLAAVRPMCWIVILFLMGSLGAQTDSVKTHNQLINKMKEQPKLKISGWSQVLFQSEWEDEALASQSFRIRRARLVAAGQLNPKLSYKLQADLGNSPALVDAYLNLRFCDAFALQAGQFKYPLSIESNISPMYL